MDWGQRQGNDYCAAQRARLGDNGGEAMRWVRDHEEVVWSMDSGATDVKLLNLGHWRE